MLVLFFTCSAQALLFNLRPYSTRRTSVVASLTCAVRISIVSASCCHVMLDTLPEAANGTNKWDFRFDLKT